jgi:hypothetical protein
MTFYWSQFFTLGISQLFHMHSLLLKPSQFLHFLCDHWFQEHWNLWCTDMDQHSASNLSLLRYHLGQSRMSFGCKRWIEYYQVLNQWRQHCSSAICLPSRTYPKDKVFDTTTFGILTNWRSWFPYFQERFPWRGTLFDALFLLLEFPIWWWTYQQLWESKSAQTSPRQNSLLRLM